MSNLSGIHICCKGLRSVIGLAMTSHLRSHSTSLSVNMASPALLLLFLFLFSRDVFTSFFPVLLPLEQIASFNRIKLSFSLNERDPPICVITTRKRDVFIYLFISHLCVQVSCFDVDFSNICGVILH